MIKQLFLKLRQLGKGSTNIFISLYIQITQSSQFLIAYTEKSASYSSPNEALLQHFQLLIGPTHRKCWTKLKTLNLIKDSSRRITCRHQGRNNVQHARVPCRHQCCCSINCTWNVHVSWGLLRWTVYSPWLKGNSVLIAERLRENSIRKIYAVIRCHPHHTKSLETAIHQKETSINTLSTKISASSYP